MFSQLWPIVLALLMSLIGGVLVGSTIRPLRKTGFPRKGYKDVDVGYHGQMGTHVTWLLLAIMTGLQWAGGGLFLLAHSAIVKAFCVAVFVLGVAVGRPLRLFDVDENLLR